MNRREDVVRGLGVLKVLRGDSLPYRRSGSHSAFVVVHDGILCSSLVIDGNGDTPVRAIGSLA
jgi:hypothetical protein